MKKNVRLVLFVVMFLSLCVRQGIFLVDSPSSSSAVPVVSAMSPFVGEVPPIVPFDSLNETWYFRSDAHTIHDTLGFKLMDVQSSDGVTDFIILSGSHNISYGVRVWVVDEDGDATELTGGDVEAVVTMTADGEDLNSTTWSCGGHSDVVDALLIRVYQRFGAGSWTLRRIFITKDELLMRFPVASWTFEYYINRTTGAETNSTFKFGSLSTMSAVTVIYEAISPWDTMFYWLGRGQFFAFLTMPWTYHLGDMFWGLIMLFFSVTTYNRYRSLNVVLAVMWIFGGVGGVLSLMIPAIGLQISWLFIAIALALTLFRLFL